MIQISSPLTNQNNFKIYVFIVPKIKDRITKKKTKIPLTNTIFFDGPWKINIIQGSFQRYYNSLVSRERQVGTWPSISKISSSNGLGARTRCGMHQERARVCPEARIFLPTLHSAHSPNSGMKQNNHHFFSYLPSYSPAFYLFYSDLRYIFFMDICICSRYKFLGQIQSP